MNHQCPSPVLPEKMIDRGGHHVNIQVMEVTWRTFLHSSEETLHLIICPEEDTRGVSKIRGETMVKIDA